jgi:hypothetical protein
MRSPKTIRHIIASGLCLLVVVLSIALLPIPPAYGVICRNYGAEEICLISIKRSAKYHWEYRAVLQINGKKQAKKRFDCRYNLEGANNQRKFVCSLIPKH